MNWRIINYALKELEPKEFYNSARHGKGCQAPSIRYHSKGILHPLGRPGFRHLHGKDKRPAGEWEKPVLVKAGKGMIDPAPLWDEDGQVYLVHAWAGSRSKMNSIVVVCGMNAEGTQVIGNPVLVYDGNDEE